MSERCKRFLTGVLLAGLVATQSGCVTGEIKKVGLGMLGGAVVGAVVGHEFIHAGEHKQFQTQNTIITSAILALVTGGVLAWHYQSMEDQMVEVSSKYSRYRLCNSEDMQPEINRELGNPPENALQLQPNQVGKLAIALDDNTKWAYPIFRKRYLPPERAETQVVSTRYIWEILKPGTFVTRTQDPQFFVEDRIPDGK